MILLGLLFNDRGTSYMWKSGSSHNQVASGSLDVNFSERKKKYLCLKDSGKIGWMFTLGLSKHRVVLKWCIICHVYPNRTLFYMDLCPAPWKQFDPASMDTSSSLSPSFPLRPWMLLIKSTVMVPWTWKVIQKMASP